MSTLTAYQARYVVPVAGEPIDEGVVVVDGRTIFSVGRSAPRNAQVVDLNALNRRNGGGVAVLPGLVNAHTHLEFSHLASPLGQPGMQFPSWIREVIRYRLTRDSESVSPDEVPSAFLNGLRECVQAGTTALGDITKPDARWQSGRTEREKDSINCGVTAFLEFLGLACDRHELAMAELEASSQRLRREKPAWGTGISPHAPYSTHWQLVQALCQHARDHSLPLAMHLAESPEELELLQSHRGPFYELLRDIGAWNPEGVPRGATTLDYLKQLAIAPRSLVIHGNYLTREEVQFIAGFKERMSVVYCPRTHTFFQHGDYPLARLLSAGVNVALGTDSRASNPDLDLMREMRHVADKHPDVRVETIVRMGTIHGATALGQHNRAGTLEPGKDADLALFALTEERPDAATLLSAPLPCVATMRRGAFLWQA